MELQQLQFPAHGEYSRFSGDPRKETEEAWHELTARKSRVCVENSH